MDDGSAAHEELLQFLHERDQEALRVLVDFHGGLEGWFKLCNARRAADPDYRPATVILRILRRGTSAGPAIRLMTHELRHMAGEPAVMAFWKSVADGGDEGWQEERRRMRDVQRAASRATSTQGRMLALDLYAVQSLVPLYRAWGQMLLDAEGGREHRNTGTPA